MVTTVVIPFDFGIAILHGRMQEVHCVPCFSHGVLRPNSVGMLQLKHRNILGLDCETNITSLTSIKLFSFLE